VLTRRGYMLERSRARSPDALTFGGYQIRATARTGVIVAGGKGNPGRGYGMDLDAVAAWLVGRA